MKRKRIAGPKIKDETAYIQSNKYLVEKLTQSRKDMMDGKGVKIHINDIWK